MRIVRISQFENSLVVHFATQDRRINAYTLASTLVGLADAAKAANSAINVGHDIEIVVEALGSGSFRAQIKAVYSKARNLFSNQALQAIVLAMLSNFIYERTFARHDDVKVEIRTDEVIIEHGQERVVVPRQVYEATRAAEKNPEFVKAIGRTLESVSRDKRVDGLGFVSSMDAPDPEILIPRDELPQVTTDGDDHAHERIIEEHCNLQIVKAILERGTRKWEFMWRGVKISAPVADEEFYSEFFAHRITIAPGDELKVLLAISQTRDEETGIFTNVGYEVRRVLEHVPRLRQASLGASPSQ